MLKVEKLSTKLKFIYVMNYIVLTFESCMCNTEKCERYFPKLLA